MSRSALFGLGMYIHFWSGKCVLLKDLYNTVTRVRMANPRPLAPESRRPIQSGQRASGNAILEIK